jgi:hypothetical protein
VIVPPYKLRLLVRILRDVLSGQEYKGRLARRRKSAANKRGGHPPGLRRAGNRI